MTRLIDADALIFELEEWKKNPNNDDSAVDLVNHFIGIIKALPSAKYITEKPNDAVKASDDVINRADAIEAICNAQCELDVPHYPQCDQIKYCDEIKALEALPSADAVDVNEVTIHYKPYPSADAVSREFYEDAIQANHGLAKDLANLKEKFESADRLKVAYICDGRACDADCTECFRTTNIEHAKHFERLGDTYMEQADRPSGEWLEIDMDLTGYYFQGYYCSECNHVYKIKCNYCPNCGARMKGGAE